MHNALLEIIFLLVKILSYFTCYSAYCLGIIPRVLPGNSLVWAVPSLLTPLPFPVKESYKDAYR